MTENQNATPAVTEADIASLQAKLRTFSETLNPAELYVFASLIERATADAEDGDVAGFGYNYGAPNSSFFLSQFSSNRLISDKGAGVLSDWGIGFRGGMNFFGRG